MNKFLAVFFLSFFFSVSFSSASGSFLTESRLYLENRDGVSSIPTLSNDTWFDIQWYLKNSGQEISGTGGVKVTGSAGADIGIEESWAKNYLGSGVKIAVVDTGANTNHKDLQKQFLNSTRNWNFLNQTSDVFNESSHGTFVAGLLAAEKDNQFGIAGIVPDSSLYIYKAGDGGSLDVTAIAAAFKRAGTDQIAVVNGSFGGGYSREIESAILANPNVLFIFAAGNNGLDNDKKPTYPCSLPAENILCVAATNSSDRLASFSNYGLKTVDVAAPGKDIVSTYMGNSLAVGDGTSFAAPIVVGVAAIIKSRYPGYTATQLKQAIIQSGDKISDLSGKVSSQRRIDASVAANLKPIAPPSLIVRPIAALKNNRYVFGGEARFNFKTDKATDRFECRLKNNPTWSGCSKSFVIRRGDLAPGNYTLLVRAVRIGGVVSEIKEINFSISYQRPRLVIGPTKKTASGFTVSIRTSGSSQLRCFWKDKLWRKGRCRSFFSIKTAKDSVLVRIVAVNRLGNRIIRQIIVK